MPEKMKQPEVSEEKKHKAGGSMSIIGLALNITMLALGIRAHNNCAAEPMIPVYMIGSGLTNLSLLIFTVVMSYLALCITPTECCKKMAEWVARFLSSSIGIGNLIWLIFGSIYVFGVDDITFEDPHAKNYCDYSPYMFAYVMTILGWIGLCIYAVILCCCCPVICCAGVTALLFQADDSAKGEEAKDEEEKVGMAKDETKGETD